MSAWENQIVRAGARMLGFPPGMGIMLSQGVRRRLLWSLAVSVLLSALDMLGVLALVPMLQFIAGVPVDTGALGVVNRILGQPDEDVLVAVLAGLVATAFVVKDVVAVVVRRWQLRFMADQEVEISRRMLTGYLVGPYSWHLVKNTSDKLWTVDYAVSIGYTTGITAALAAFTEVFTITLIFVGLLFVSPVATWEPCSTSGSPDSWCSARCEAGSCAAGAAATTATQAAAKTSLQALGAAKEIKLRHAEDRFVQEYAPARRAGARARATATLLNEVPEVSPRGRLRRRDRSPRPRRGEHQWLPECPGRARCLRRRRHPDPAQRRSPHRRARGHALQPHAARPPGRRVRTPTGAGRGTS